MHRQQALPHPERAVLTPRPMPFSQSTRLHDPGALARTGQKPLAREELERGDNSLRNLLLAANFSLGKPSTGGTMLPLTSSRRLDLFRCVVTFPSS